MIFKYILNFIMDAFYSQMLNYMGLNHKYIWSEEDIRKMLLFYKIDQNYKIKKYIIYKKQQILFSEITNTAWKVLIHTWVQRDKGTKRAHYEIEPLHLVQI
ncbi:hypothetical protein phytr_10070 [Candidatus Phycorickettsia trachydisci]|uniref:Uncharacterized protein n=1 Tax=Candidatus Phycorickettsia trachydisci TaxID=2115978 RepID=A0A2P1P9K8_9RICK|nr:hypothetical protein phytr_10070 [Candidatus Phycorickettsia trachydisci]